MYYIRAFASLLLIFNCISFVKTSSAGESYNNIPIADIHMHVYGKKVNGYDFKYFIDIMNKNGIKWAGGVGNFQPKLQDILGDAYIPAFGQREYFKAFRKGGKGALVDLENTEIKQMFAQAVSLYERQEIKGFGEIHTENSHSGPVHMRRKVRLKNPVVEKMFEISEKFDGFVQIHAEWNNEFLSDIKFLTEKFPKTIVILSHCLPGSTPITLKKIFDLSEKIVCEVSGENGPKIAGLVPRSASLYGPKEGRIYGISGIKPDWLQLIEGYPDRFLIGSDPCCDYAQYLPEIYAEIREYFLKNLSDRTMKLVAFENAQKLFNLK